MPALEKSAIAEAEKNTSAFLGKISIALESAKTAHSPWIFGTDVPTALDAHTIPFLARLVDVQRSDMFDENIAAYTARVLKMNVWEQTMQGRKTVYPAYL